MPPSVEAPWICSACGVLWALEGADCSLCGTSGARPRRAPSAADAVWVATFASFTCRTCGEASPMHGLEADCKVECASCGQVQLLDPDAFSEAMALAFEVGDYVARGAFPLDDPATLHADESTMRGLGVSHAYAEFASTGLSLGELTDRSRNVRMRLSPGHPLCEGCREPLEATLDARGLVASCAPCGSRVVYERPANPEGIRPFPRGALDGSLREGALDVRVDEAAGGVAAIRCPVCSAAITGVDGRGLARCGYCGSVARVGPRLRALAGSSGEPQTKPYWMLFRGDSPTRRAIASRAEGRARKRAEGEARRAAEQRAREARGRATETRADEPPRSESGPRSAWSDRRIRVSVGVALAGAIVAYAALGRPTPPESRADAPPPPMPVAAADPEPMSEDPAAAYRTPTPAVQTLPSFCGCPVRGEGGGTSELLWGVETLSMVRFGADVTLSVAYSWIVGDARFPVLTNDQTAPPNPIRSMLLELAVACDDDAMLVSDGRYLTRWSLSERRVVASAAVPSPFGPRPPAEGAAGECYRAELRAGTMVFEDAGGLAHRIRLPRELR